MDIPDIGADAVLPDIGADPVLPDIGAAAVESVPPDGEVTDGEVVDVAPLDGSVVVGDAVAEGVVVFDVSGVVLVGPGGVEVGAVGGAVGVSGTCAKAPGAADASMAATALASAKRCKVVRVDMGEGAPFY